MNTCDERLRATVHDIAHELEAIHDGTLYEDENYEYIEIDDIDAWKEEQYEKKKNDFLSSHNPEEYDRELYDDVNQWIEDEIGTVEDIELGDPVSIYDYIDKRALSIENWKIDRNGECVGGEILFCYGGPTVWATDRGVFGSWGGDRSEYFSSTIGDMITEYLTETMPRH